MAIPLHNSLLYSANTFDLCYIVIFADILSNIKGKIIDDYEIIKRYRAIAKDG